MFMFWTNSCNKPLESHMEYISNSLPYKVGDENVTEYSTEICNLLFPYGTIHL